MKCEERKRAKERERERELNKGKRSLERKLRENTKGKAQALSKGETKESGWAVK